MLGGKKKEISERNLRRAAPVGILAAYNM